MKIAVFPGSFDPFTIGHEDIVKRALPLFDKIIIAIGVNSEKKYMFSLETREAGLKAVFKNEPKIEIAQYKGLTVDFCVQQKANYILRGLRTAKDFEYECPIAQMNTAMQPGVETIFITSNPAYSAVSSTIVREILRNGGDAGRFVPSEIVLSTKY